MDVDTILLRDVWIGIALLITGVCMVILAVVNLVKKRTLDRPSNAMDIGNGTAMLLVGLMMIVFGVLLAGSRHDYKN